MYNSLYIKKFHSMILLNKNLIFHWIRKFTNKYIFVLANQQGLKLVNVLTVKK